MMSNFYEVDLGASEATQKDLDEIALFHGGRLGTIGYGYRIRGPLPKERHGYGFLWINTQGMGNHGTVVLTPRSDRAREMLRAGRVLELEKEYNIPHKLALRLEAAQRGVPYSRESRVIKCVLANINSPGWDCYPGSGNGVWRWVNAWCIDPCGCTAPRLDSVAEIIKRLSV